jgi:Tfp pilus assembly PilM family ATPase
MHFFSSRRPSVGLDIGSTCLRVVALRRSRRGWRLTAAGEAAITPSALGEHDTRPPGISHVAEELLSALGLRRVDVSVAIPANAAIVRRLTLAADDLPTVGERLALEVEQHASFDRDDAAISYQLLDRVERGRPADVGVLVAAARRSHVAERRAVVSRRGRRTTVADIEGLALTNAFTLNYPDQCDSAALVHVGHASTVVCVVRQGELLFTRGIARGLEADGPDLAVRELATTVRRECQEQHVPAERGEPGQAARVLLSGGGARSTLLASELARALGSPVGVFDPLRRIETTKASRGADAVDAAYALAVGLALRRKGDA